MCGESLSLGVVAVLGNPQKVCVTCSYVCVSVSGSWSCWSSWSQCSSSCGGGYYQRTRTCGNPPPAGGGDICIGLHTEEALCSTHACEGESSEGIDGVFAPLTMVVGAYPSTHWRKAVNEIASYLVIDTCIPFVFKPPPPKKTWGNQIGAINISCILSLCSLNKGSPVGTPEGQAFLFISSNAFY